MTKFKKMGVKTGLSDEVEDIIIQVLGHKERRNILKILSSSEDGAMYSEILRKTGLSLLLGLFFNLRWRSQTYRWESREL